MSNCALIYTVFPTAEQAKIAGRKLVAEKLVACANVLPAHTAIYEWEGVMVEESEVVMLLKTTKANVGAVQARVVELHEYDVPCAVCIDITTGNPAFLRWVEDSVK